MLRFSDTEVAGCLGPHQKLVIVLILVLLFNSKKGFCVKSFGTGSVVKLPGGGPQQSNIYSFDTTYEEMFQDLVQKDPQLYPTMKQQYGFL